MPDLKYEVHLCKNCIADVECGEIEFLLPEADLKLVEVPQSECDHNDMDSYDRIVTERNLDYIMQNPAEHLTGPPEVDALIYRKLKEMYPNRRYVQNGEAMYTVGSPLYMLKGVLVATEHVDGLYFDDKDTIEDGKRPGMHYVPLNDVDDEDE